MNKLIIIILLAFSVDCQTNSWEGITPLKSTRSDVEKLLGSPTPLSVAKYAAGYRGNEGKVNVLYSTGLCNVNPDHGWNVTEFTVISISYYPDHPPRLADLKIDRSKFERRPDPATLGSDFYTNEVDGIALTVDTSDNTVTRFQYFPASKDDYLMCKNLAEVEPK